MSPLIGKTLFAKLRKFGLPFQTYFPHGQGTVSAGSSFASGCRQTGQLLRHILDQPFPPLTRCDAAGHVKLIDHFAKLFPLLQCCEKRERFSVGCYRSG